jgi:large subunit ribosomal protein L29
MKALDLRQKSAAELQEELLVLRKEQFNLRMQKTTGNPKITEFQRVRRDIARIKTVMNETKSGDA